MNKPKNVLPSALQIILKTKRIIFVELIVNHQINYIKKVFVLNNVQLDIIYKKII